MGRVSLALGVNLGHQRAGCIEHRQLAALRFPDDSLGDAMGAEHRDRAIGNFVQLLHEAGTLALQGLHYMAVMDDLMTHIDRLAIFLQRPLDGIDRPNDARAETPRLGKNYTHHLTQLPA